MTPLYSKCMELYDLCQIRPSGQHQDREGTWQPAYTASLGNVEVMSLLDHPGEPDKNILVLNIPGQGAQVKVYANPAAHGHNHVVEGASEAEALIYLKRFR